MSEGNYIVHDDMDELKLLKYRNYNGKFSSGALGLVIAPTLACNLLALIVMKLLRRDLWTKKFKIA